MKPVLTILTAAALAALAVASLSTGGYPHPEHGGGPASAGIRAPVTPGEDIDIPEIVVVAHRGDTASAGAP